MYYKANFLVAEREREHTGQLLDYRLNPNPTQGTPTPGVANSFSISKIPVLYGTGWLLPCLRHSHFMPVIHSLGPKEFVLVLCNVKEQDSVYGEDY
jgi:hypothetical protein